MANFSCVCGDGAAVGAVTAVAVVVIVAGGAAAVAVGVVIAVAVIVVMGGAMAVMRARLRGPTRRHPSDCPLRSADA